MKIEVPGSGPYSSKVMIVGEAPAKNEIETGKNFIGASGDILFEALSEHKLNRYNLYITNVFKVRLPGDDVKRVGEILSKDEIDEQIRFLHLEVKTINPNVILALGNTALAALTGKTKIGGTGILKWRGSILRGITGHKVIPTIHPAAFIQRSESKELFSWKQMIFLRFDINRAVEESTTPAILLPKRNIVIARRSYDLYSFLRRYEGRDKVANDIETYRGMPICTGFAFSKDEAIAVPLFDMRGPGNTSILIPRHERIQMWRLVAELLSSNIRKIGQNYDFDMTIQDRFGLKVNEFYSDTILKTAVLFPELPKSLGVLTSLFTREPYYKDEGREYNPIKDPPERLLRYMCVDAMVTYEIDEFLERELDLCH